VEGQLTIDVAVLITSVLPIEPSSLRVAVPPTSGARASFSPAGELLIDYSGVLFAGRDVLTIEVCNIGGECSQQQISIDVVGDIVIFNGISPNGDGQNDFFFLQYIDVLPAARENQVLIFNRWGDLVWQTNDYNNLNNRFEGNSSSGGELPSGTYYYRIQFASGVPERTGYLSLKR
jgi:gliding motility-associated-like protein